MLNGDRVVRWPCGSRRFVQGAIVLASAGIVAWAAALPLLTRQAINCRVTSRPIPLYLKGLEFLLRDAEYRRLAAEISRGLTTDAARAMTLARWTSGHIRPTPGGWPVVDDHVLHIIIRGYGEADQVADVFTTLAAYAGIPAFWKIVRARTGDGVAVLTFARIDGRWTVWDVRRGIAFTNARGVLAGVEELRANPALIEAAVGAVTYADQPYRFFVEDGIASLQIPRPLRAYQQMPGPRVLFEAQRLWQRWRGGADSAALNGAGMSRDGADRDARLESRPPFRIYCTAHSRCICYTRRLNQIRRSMAHLRIG